MKKAGLLIFVILVLINLPPLKWIGGYDDLSYSNANGTFTFSELNYAGRNFSYCLNKWEAFKSLNTKDTVLYRITPINALKVWRWGDYMFKEKYKLHYKDFNEIEAVRGSVANKSGFQDF